MDGLYSRGQLSSQFCLWSAKNALASEGPNGDPIATLSTCLYNILLNIKFNSLVANDRRSLNSLFSNHEQCRSCKKIVSANFNSFFKGDVSKKRINI